MATSDPVYRSQTTIPEVSPEIQDAADRINAKNSARELSFRRWLYELGVQDEEVTARHRFDPRPDWLTDPELASYNAGRTDQRTGQAGRP